MQKHTWRKKRTLGKNNNMFCNRMFYIVAKLFILLFSMQCSSPKQIVSTDHKNNKVIQGEVSLKQLYDDSAFDWFKNVKPITNTTDSTLLALKKAKQDYTMVIALGTWCGDTKVLLPEIYTTLQYIQYPEKKLKCIGFDRDKNGVANEKSMYKITNLPTIIFYKNNIELGRITEAPHKSLAYDWLEIISQH